MTVRIGINGFGRIGRLVVRALRDHPSLQLVHINELNADATTSAHLLDFDTVHDRYSGAVTTDGDTITVDGATVTHSSQPVPGAVA